MKSSEWKTAPMKLTPLVHRQKVRTYLDFPPKPAMILAPRERDAILNCLHQLYEHLGSLDWVTRWFISLLDVYWKVTEISMEDSAKLECSIGDYQHLIIAARQFVRAQANRSNPPVLEPSINISHYWSFSDPYPPDIKGMREPIKQYFTILDHFLHEMLSQNDPQKAMILVAGLTAVFSQTYPTEYLDPDEYFKRYLQNEVMGAPTDDDYTFYLSRMIHYMIFYRH